MTEQMKFFSYISDNFQQGLVGPATLRETLDEIRDNPQAILAEAERRVRSELERREQLELERREQSERTRRERSERELDEYYHALERGL